MPVHVVGAGLAGLAAALALAPTREVILYEAGPAAGGRCRSYFDQTLGVRIDNGNHLILAGNASVRDYLARAGAESTMRIASPAFPFLDLATDERWTLRPNAGRLPWWVLARDRRVPGTKARDYASLPRLLRPQAGATVASLLPPGPLTARLLEPLAISALNTMPARASAALFAAVLRDTLARGGAACRPVLPLEGWSETLIDPAVARIEASGGRLRLATRVAGIATRAGRVTGLTLPGETVAVAATDAVILAVPAWVASTLMPEFDAPDEFEAIVNLHYRVAAPDGAPALTGLVGGLAEWVFVKPGVVSVTISAANRYADRDAEALALPAWSESRRALGLTGPVPPWRLLREKRATFAATPAQDARRPLTRTQYVNLFLAGDWTATGLPATIEGAIKSGFAAAQLASV